MKQSRVQVAFSWISVLIFTEFILTVEGVYSAAKETEIRSETVLAAGYDMISRPVVTTNIKIGISVLAIDELRAAMLFGAMTSITMAYDVIYCDEQTVILSDFSSKESGQTAWMCWLAWLFTGGKAFSIQDLKSQKLETAGWITLEWEDSRLTWDHTAKDDIEEIFSKPANIWKPELVVDNSMEDLGIVSDDDLYLRLKYDGTVEWEPPRLFITHCQVDITYYPYDKQKCSINIASWGYTSNEVSLDTITTAVNLEDFEQHGEWKITSYNTVKTNLVETLDDGTVRQFPQIEFWLTLERRSGYYNLNVVMPVFLTSLLVALTFIVPVECGEKLSYVLTVFLSIAVLLTLVADSMPSTSITTSVLGLYLGLVTILSALGILLTVIILILFFKEGYAKSKSFIMIITRFAAKVTCSSGLSRGIFTNKVKPAPEGDDDENISKSDVTDDVTWKEVAIVLDRFCFLVFTSVTVLMNLSFVIALVVGGEANDP